MSVTSVERANLGYALDKEEGEAVWVLGMLETIEIGGEDTAGEFRPDRGRRARGRRLTLAHPP